MLQLVFVTADYYILELRKIWRKTFWIWM